MNASHIAAVGTIRHIWWADPTRFTLFLLLPLYCSFIAFDFKRVVPNAYIPSWNYGWGALLLLAIAAGVAFAAAATRTSRTRSIARPNSRTHARSQKPAMQWHIPSAALAVLLALSLFAYAFWFSPLVAQPQLLIEIFTGGRYNLRNTISTTPGVTTLTQCAVAYAVAYAIKLGQQRDAVRWWEHAGFYLLVLLAMMRAFAWSERLAVVEMAVSYGVARAAFLRVNSPLLRTSLNLAPVVGGIALYLVFTGTEYFRSWDFYRDQYTSVWVFSFERLLTYYATASNNGIGLLIEDATWPAYTGRYLAEWFYLMPFTGDYMRSNFGDATLGYVEFLQRFARPEFNNQTGLFPIVFDVGYFGSAIYFLFVGALIGCFWQGFKRQQLGGLLFYPSSFLFLMELMRFNYFSASRFFPVALSLLFLYCAATLKRHRLQIESQPQYT